MLSPESEPRLEYRSAINSDSAPIRSLVVRSGINPRGLDWRRFLVATDPEGQIVACGQVKPHGDGSRELASIAVRPGARRRGVGSEMVRRLMDGSGPPLWLMCRSGLVGFYARLGFSEAVEADRMPTFFRRVHRLARLADPLFPEDNRLAIMAWEGEGVALAHRSKG